MIFFLAYQHSMMVIEFGLSAVGAKWLTYLVQEYLCLNPGRDVAIF